VIFFVFWVLKTCAGVTFCFAREPKPDLEEEPDPEPESQTANMRSPGRLNDLASSDQAQATNEWAVQFVERRRDVLIALIILMSLLVVALHTIFALNVLTKQGADIVQVQLETVQTIMSQAKNNAMITGSAASNISTLIQASNCTALQNATVYGYLNAVVSASDFAANTGKLFEMRE
jgi:hypothetical protein